MNTMFQRPRALRARATRILRSALLAAPLALAGIVATAESAVDPATGEHVQAAIPMPAVRPGFPVSTFGAPVSQPPTMADLNEDGKAEIICVDDQGKMVILTGAGIPYAGTGAHIGGVPSGPIAVGDLDRDGYLELVSVTTTGRVRVFTPEGDLEAVPADGLPSPPVGGALLTELDRSGRLAILVVTENGQMHAFAATGAPYPGWPVQGSAKAVSPPFTFTGFDNFPRVGYLGANPDRAQIFFTYALPDTQASFSPGYAFGPAAPVTGARSQLFLLPDAEFVYVFGKNGGLTRIDPDVISGSMGRTTLAGLPNDSVFVQPALLDATGDMVPELAALSLRGDTLSVWLLDGANGNPLAGFPRRYLSGQPVGGMACVDVGDNNAAEILFTHSGDKVSCVRTNGTSAWILGGLPSVAAPAVADLDNDGGIDMVVVTTNGFIHAYTLGNAGLGPRTIEWQNAGGTPRHDGRHVIRDRAVVQPFWPPPITPENTFTTRAVIGPYDGDALPDVMFSDYATGKTFGFNGIGGTLAGMHAEFNQGAVLDAPAIGDVTGDGVYEAIQATSTGRLVWRDKNGGGGTFLVDNNRQLSPPVLADLNNDGNLDVVVGSSAGRVYAVRFTPTVAVLTGFPVATTGPVTLPPAVGDITGDGQTDIVAVGSPRTLHAFPRTGAVPLTGWPRTFTSGHTLFQPILVPVNGQSGLCVAFGRATAQDSVVAHLVGANGAPLAGWPRRLTGAFDYISGPVAGDFDNNGTPDFVYATGGDSLIVYSANGNRVMARRIVSPGNLEVCGLVDLDLDLRPEIVLINDHAQLQGIRFNGLDVRAFQRLLLSIEVGATPAFGDLGNDGRLDMAFSDLGQPIVYTWGFGTWNPSASPWPMKGHDRYRTNAFSGKTVVGIDPIAGPPVHGTGLAHAVPNPSRSSVAFTHTRPIAGAFEAALYDVKGRLVRVLGRGIASEVGEQRTWTWDGRDENGASVPAGMYFYQVRDGAGTLRQKVVRLP